MKFSREVRKYATDRYEQFARIPVVSSGRISLQGDRIDLNFKQRDLRNNKHTAFSKTFSVDESGSAKVVNVVPTVQDGSIVLESLSPSQRFLCQFIKLAANGGSSIGGEDGSSKYEIRVWDTRGQILQQIPVDPDSMHGIVANDGHFTRIVWNTQDDEQSFLYEAEPKRVKRKRYWEHSSSSANGDDNEKDKEDEDSEGFYSFVHKEDYGEGLIDRRRPVLFICHWRDSRVETVAGIPKHIAVAFATYTPDCSGVVFTGYDLRGERRLGLKYCMQRPCSLYYLSLKADESERQLVKLTTDEDHNARTPVFSPDGRHLVFLSTGKVSHHHGCHRIMIMDWTGDNLSTMESRPLVDKVWYYDIVAAKDNTARYSQDFPGIFATHLGSKCWGVIEKQEQKHQQYILVNTTWRSTHSIAVVSVPEGKIHRLLPFNDSVESNGQHQFESLVMLDHNPSTNQVLAYQSSPNKPYQVLLGKLSVADDGSIIVKWTLVEDAVRDILPPETADLLKGFKWSVDYVPCGSESDDKKASTWFESILLEPSKNDDKGSGHPLIVLPHGGPHSCTMTLFSIHNAYLASLGYMFVCPNYRGSVGFGESFVEVLPGHVGDWDVKDTQNAALFACGDLEEGAANRGKVARDRIAICGGSHGGFLSLHGVGQYPSFYKATVVRNPVCNLATNITTDITDWCFYETARHDIHDQPMHYTSEYAQKALESSPIYHVGKVSAHVLLLVGEVDRRVPPTQAREYYYAMQTHRKFAKDGQRFGDCEMMLYPKNAHPIDLPSEEADAFISTYLWLNKYMP